MMFYLRACVERFGLAPHLRYGVEVLEARWDGAACVWLVRTDAGELTADVLVAATGPLCEPLRAAEQRQETHRHLDLTEKSGIGRNDHVAGQRNLEAASQGSAIDRRDRRHRHVFEPDTGFGFAFDKRFHRRGVSVCGPLAPREEDPSRGARGLQFYRAT